MKRGHQGKTDTNQAAVVEALVAVGAYVQSLAAVGAGCPDLLVGFRRKTFLLEVKDGSKVPSERLLAPLQKRFFVNWRGGPLFKVESPAEALRVIGAVL